MSISLNARVLHNQLAEAHENSFQVLEIDRCPAANALQRFVDVRLLHQALRERGVERRQSQSAVAVNLHELAARTKKNDGAELWVDAAAQNQLVSLQLHHGLDGDAEERFRPGSFAHRGFDFGERATDRVFRCEIELHAADVGLVRDGFGMKLQHYRKAHRTRDQRGFPGRARDARFERGNSVELKHLLRFHFREDRAAALPNAFEDRFGC